MTDTLSRQTSGSPLTEAGAEGWLPSTCFKTGPPRRTGLELELIVRDPQAPAAHLPASRSEPFWDALHQLGLTSRLTREPGGQVELSSPPACDVVSAVASLRRDLAAVTGTAHRLRLELVGSALDPLRPGRRALDHPRYAAMEAYFGADRPATRTMMCQSASLQVNVEGGRTAGVDRWDLLHAVGPALVAAFANSAVREGRPTGWRSSRMAAWLALDPARTHPPRPRPGEDPAAAWVRYALDAPLMLVRRRTGSWSAPPGLTFRQWLRRGRDAVPDRAGPDLDDLDYHLTTLFPPVRPRGFLEVRYLDAQPLGWWPVPAAVISALMDDDRCAETALAACEPVAERWTDAARCATADPELHRAAVRVLETCVAGLRRRPGHGALARLVERYCARWTRPGRCPADDALDDLPARTTARIDPTSGTEETPR